MLKFKCVTDEMSLPESVHVYRIVMELSDSADCGRAAFVRGVLTVHSCWSTSKAYVLRNTSQWPKSLCPSPFALGLPSRVTS